MVNLNEPLAIIGMSCRFPKAANISEFLALLEQGKSGMDDIPLDRWDNKQYYDPDSEAPGKLCMKQLGFIDNIKNFDADFFNISRKEAKFMAPQLRVFMETCYHALEDANLSLDSIKNSNTGVFVGCGRNEYPALLQNQGMTLDDLTIHFSTGNVLNALAGRIAYTFDFHGPIQAIDTACSSSMTAIHNACLSLQSGDCTMAIAGGVNVILIPESSIALSKAKMVSPESRCKTFSEDADGYARSEGCGVLVLKPLSKAIQDKDRIHAVIKGSAINSDGKSKGFTVPNVKAQEALIRSALAKAKLLPGDVDYIETHGTGTPLADPIEVKALTHIFSEYHSQEHPLYISSVKTNIGHCESASGVAAVIKAVLSLKKHQLFKHLNFKKLNPEIKLKNTLIPLENMEWFKKHGLRNAGVSSFGFSGANAHVILQEAPERIKEQRILPQESLLLLSAKSKAALELLLSSYQHYLSTTDEEFADICYTAATCRTHFLFRVAIKASTAQEAAAFIAGHEYTIHQIKKETNNLQLPQTLEQLQGAYLDGCLIHWSDFYKSFPDSFEKVTLPLYEFDREEYWFGDQYALKDAAVPKNWCFQLQWQQQALNKKNRKIQGNRWLLIGARQLAADFIAQGLDLVLEDEPYSLAGLNGIIFAAALDLKGLTDLDAQKNLIKKLLDLLKKLDHQKLKLQLIVLSSNAVAELAIGEPNLNQSPLTGFCKTQVLELPQWNTIHIDLDKNEEGNYATQVLDEINYNHGKYYEHMLAYREGKRLVARLKERPFTEKKIAINGEGRYLITGGCGGLGLVTAQALLSAGAREVILISRNVDKPEIKSALKKIQSSYPARMIRAVSLDISNREKLHALLLELKQDGLLKGIIHAAGASIKAPLLEHSDEDVDVLFSAKVNGGWYLHELTQDCDLDFFIVYSSVAAVFGSNKESVYGAANSFLDALIAERQSLGLVGTAVQWGPWAEVGMASKSSRNPGLKHALVTQEQGHAWIKMLLNSPLNPTCIIAPEYLQFMLDFVPKPLPGFHQCVQNDLGVVETRENTHSSSWLSTYFELNENQRFKACQDLLFAVCKETLECLDTEELDEDEAFFEMGFDSLMLTEMAGRLKEKLEPAIKVHPTVGFDYPSINHLAQYIQSELEQFAVSQPQTKPPEEAIAIIGMSCSFPNAPDLDAFERLNEEGLSGIKEIPKDRWDNSKYYDPHRDTPGKSYVSQLGLIQNIKEFDAHFFGISPREAKLLEPQQRIFLECCYLALEHANYQPKSLRSSMTGVFAGVGPNEYYAQLEQSGFSNEELSAYSITGNVLNLIPGRVAYFFDFKGPSISIDTACSSSLVAVHYACHSLKNGEIDYALAGGVNVLLRPESNITLCQAKALSPEGLCKTFDESADGYVRGEGCGVIFLKRLSDAIRDKDTVLAVIKASAVNNDGKSAGLTVPNGKSQEAVMIKALEHSGLSSSDIGYVEAHGTGTPLGDPIEVRAINKVYGGHRKNPLYIGTVKTNIGHLESASGIAGLIKTVIGLQKKKIYKHLNLKQLNPDIPIQDTRIALQNTVWNTDGTLRSAGVNAFGFSGTNAHVIVQEFPVHADQRKAETARKQILILSAKSQNSLDHLARIYQDYLLKTQNHFADLCFTAATCRDHYSYRLAVVAETAVQAAQFLESNLNNTQDLQDDSAKDLLTDYLQGKKVDWASYYTTGIRVALPHYIFDRREFWPDKKKENIQNPEEIHPLLGQMLSMPGNHYLFTQKLDLDRLSYLKQHILFEKVIFPATAFIESGLAAAKNILKTQVFCLEGFTIERQFHPQQGQEIQLQVKAKNDQGYKISIFAKQHDMWQVHSEMNMYSLSGLEPKFIDLDALKSFFGSSVDVSKIYEDFKERSIFYGAEFQVLQESYVATDSVLSHIAWTKTNQDKGYYYHPVLLDGAMQSMLLLSRDHYDRTVYIPYAFTRMSVFQEAPRGFWAHLTKREVFHQNELCIDIKLYDDSGLLIAHIEGLKLKKVTRNHFMSHEFSLQHLYQIKWNRLSFNTQAQAKLPEFWVIAKNPMKAKKISGNLNYHLIQDFNELVEIENKNIIFLYEQEEFNTLFHCCQTLFISCPKSFILVTENAYAIKEEDRVNPYHTMASSFWKSFRNELDLDKNYTVDLDENAYLIEALSYLFANPSEHQIAFRDSIYIPKLKKKQVSLSHRQEETLFHPDASYLITGGTGGLAKPLIEYLMSRGVKHIFLNSRFACPNEIRMLIEDARKKQVFMSHFQADASNYQHMEELIANIEQSSNPLKGVFHLAGAIQDGLIVNLTDEQVSHVCTAKRDSAWIMHQLTQKLQLDLFVLFSSSASVLGAMGQSNYVAANGFLDGLAHLRQEQGLPALAINWGPFQTRGMAANLSQALQDRGFILLAEDSMGILDILLQSQLTQIAVCPIHWDVYCHYSPKQTDLSELLQHPLAPEDKYFLNSLKQQTHDGRINLLSRALCEIVADVLALDDPQQITAKDNLFSMGLDSLMSLEIRNRIHDKLQCQNLHLSIEYFIHDPNVDKIARYVADELHTIFIAENGNPLAKAHDSDSSAEIPVSDAQYVFWALNALNYGFNIGLQLQIHGPLNKEYLFQAFDAVVQNNSAFWINFLEDVPIQMLKKQGQLELIYEEEKPVPFYNNMMRLIPLNRQPLIRLYLYKINQNLHELHLLIPHIIVDDLSCDMMLEQFKKNYEDLALGKKLIPIEEKNSYLDYVRANTIHYEQNLKEKIDFWRSYNKGIKRLNFKPECYCPDAAAIQTHYLFHYPIAPKSIERFIDWHKERNINISTGFIALCQMVFHQMTGQKIIPITLMGSGREGSQYKSVIGLFSEYKRINVRFDNDNTYNELIHSIEEELLKTAPYQKCSQLIKDSGFKSSPVSLVQHAIFIYKKLFHREQFKKSKINSVLIDYYFKLLSRMEFIRKKSVLKHKLNQLAHWNLPLQKPEELRVLISMTPSLFTKESPNRSFADLQYSFPDRFVCMDRATGSGTLWIYFSKNQQGIYHLSINGPITTDCKNQIARYFNEMISNTCLDCLDYGGI